MEMRDNIFFYLSRHEIVEWVAQSVYGLDCPGVESRCGRDFAHLSRPAVGPTQPAVQWVPSLSRG